MRPSRYEGEGWLRFGPLGGGERYELSVGAALYCARAGADPTSGTLGAGERLDRGTQYVWVARLSVWPRVEEYRSGRSEARQYYVGGPAAGVV